MKLSMLNVGETAEIVKVGAVGELKKRLMDMGITKGTLVSLKKVAPLGDPMDFTVKGYQLSLRKNEASEIEVKKV